MDKCKSDKNLPQYSALFYLVSTYPSLQYTSSFPKRHLPFFEFYISMSSFIQPATCGKRSIKATQTTMYPHNSPPSENTRILEYPVLLSPRNTLTNPSILTSYSCSPATFTSPSTLPTTAMGTLSFVRVPSFRESFLSNHQAQTDYLPLPSTFAAPRKSTSNQTAAIRTRTKSSSSTAIASSRPKDLDISMSKQGRHMNSRSSSSRPKGRSWMVKAHIRPMERTNS